MAAAPAFPGPPSLEELRGLSYEDTVAAKPPIPITTATTPPNAHKGIAGHRRAWRASQSSPNRARSKLYDVKRDSGLATSTSTARDSRTTLGTEVEESPPSIGQLPSLPIISAPDPPSIKVSSKPDSSAGTHTSQTRHQAEATREPENDVAPKPPFLGILTEIPTGSFEDLTIPGQVEFSKRGSMLIGGKKANTSNGANVGNGRAIGSRRRPLSFLSPAPPIPSRNLSADDEALSQKVRSMYQEGGQEEGNRATGILEIKGNGNAREETIRLLDGSASRSTTHGGTVPAADAIANPPGVKFSGDPTDQGISSLLRGPNELAGGMEDWEDLNGDVDRYGFIVPRKISSQASSLNSARASPDPPRIQRVSTLLQLASETPRQSRSRLGMIRSTQSPARSTDANSTRRPESVQFRPTSSQSSYRSTKSQSSFRSATNRLPMNKDRRCVDEAGDMLTLPPGLADIAEDQEDGQMATNLKKRECDREDKWRKMAKSIKRDKHGGGMVFEYDTRSPKVIERTWKGIPDRWRATAWHAFLTASAKKRNVSISDGELITIFKTLLNQGSPDDVQIDIDVPRTINSHIMFRRRYRGGQRLLFRVLHCVSIYFPDTGYVQGMAALAATLLCYYDEEMTFVMMVRLWQLRGLDRLYKAGFEGLMQALEEFEGQWLGKGDVAAKLTELNIPPTSYGTRWYLTLFNYSIPFPAQLRVWDVFMLLGDPDPAPAKSDNKASYNGGLDVLHACSAALIDGTREILIDSDFENAMKVLTSWIPIKDEELLMRVARVEWKTKKRRNGGRR